MPQSNFSKCGFKYSRTEVYNMVWPAAARQLEWVNQLTGIGSEFFDYIQQTKPDEKLDVKVAFDGIVERRNALSASCCP